MEVKKVLKVEISKDRYCSCNVCYKRVSEKEKEKFIIAEQMYDVELGSERHTTVIRLCNECLNEFADVLWQRLESEE